MAFFFLTSVRGTILERLASLTASSYVHVIYSVSTDRSSVVTEIILDGRYSHLKKQQKITDQLKTKTNKQQQKNTTTTTTTTLMQSFLLDLNCQQVGWSFRKK